MGVFDLKSNFMTPIFIQDYSLVDVKITDKIDYLAYINVCLFLQSPLISFIKTSVLFNFAKMYFINNAQVTEFS